MACDVKLFERVKRACSTSVIAFSFIRRLVRRAECNHSKHKFCLSPRNAELEQLAASLIDVQMTSPRDCFTLLMISTGNIVRFDCFTSLCLHIGLFSVPFHLRTYCSRWPCYIVFGASRCADASCSCAANGIVDVLNARHTGKLVI